MLKIILLLLAIALAFVLLGLYRNLATPTELGVQDGRLAPLPSTPNAISSQTSKEDRRVEALPFIGSLSESKERMLSVLRDYGSISIVTQSDRYIHAIDRSALIGFRDDLEFYFDANEKLIHIRSASRVGYSDMGVNRKRYAALRARYLGETD